MYNFNVNTVDLGAFQRGRDAAAERRMQQDVFDLKKQQVAQTQAQQEQIQSLTQAYLGGDASALNKIAAIDPATAKQVQGIQQGQQPAMPDMKALGDDLTIVQSLAKSGSPMLVQTLGTMMQKYQGTGFDNEIMSWAQQYDQDPQAAIGQLDSTIQAFDPPEKKDKVGRYKMSDNGFVFDSATGKVEVNPSLKQAISAPKLEVGDRQSINKDITTLTKDTVGIYKTAKDLEKLSANMSGPASIAMVFKFMKALDPTSVVREGEFATAENSAGVPEAIRNTYNKLMEGGRLGDQQVKSFVSTARDLANSAIDSSSTEITNYLNTYEDTLPKRFKTEIMKRIPEKFQVEGERVESIKPMFSPALNSEVTEQQIQEIMNRGYTREEVLQKLGVN